MFGRLGDFVDGLNLDVKVMTGSTQAYIAKEKAVRKVKDTADDVKDFFAKPVCDDEDKKDEKTSKIPEDENENKEDENTDLPRFMQEAKEQVKKNRVAAEEKKKEEAKKNEAIEVQAKTAADIFFDEIKEGALAKAETEEEKEQINAIFDQIKDKSNLKDVLVELGNSLTTVGNVVDTDKLENQVVAEVVETIPEEVVATPEGIYGPDMSGLIEKEENIVQEVTPADLEKALSNAHPVKLSEEEIAKKQAAALKAIKEINASKDELSVKIAKTNEIMTKLNEEIGKR